MCSTSRVLSSLQHQDLIYCTMYYSLAEGIQEGNLFGATANSLSKQIKKVSLFSGQKLKVLSASAKIFFSLMKIWERAAWQM